MTPHLYHLFRQTSEQLRRQGARGGRATARNRRARIGATTAPPRQPPAPVPPQAETVAQALATLDAQFPWLRGAEKRASRPATSRG
jgi:hypothetical protein